MAHDFITYRNHHVHLHDSIIWALRHFLMIAAEWQDNIHQFFSNWQWIGPGIYMGTDLHKYTDGDLARIDQLKHVLKNARTAISGFGDTIPLTYLDKLPAYNNCLAHQTAFDRTPNGCYRSN